MWSLGVLVGGPIWFVVIAGLVVTAVVLFRKERNCDPFDEGVFKLFGWITTGTVILLTVIVAASYFPYGKQYHYWKPVSGVVANVNHRLISDGDNGMDQRFVVTLRGSAQQYGIDDTRASLLKSGDRVDLSCIREWQYASESGWACRWGRQ